MKRIAAIHDISCYGKCSLTVILPVLSAYNHEVCPVPTALLSAHTGIAGFTFLDLSEEMENIIAHFKQQQLFFDCIYSGFLAKEEQLETVEQFIDDFHGTSLVVIDPVMGDNGEIYKTYTEKMCEKMRVLIRKANIITPNITESAILLAQNPKTPPDMQTIIKWLEQLNQMGPEICVITGIKNNGKQTNVARNSKTNELFTASCPDLGIDISGTGDLFTSVFLGNILKEIPIDIALQKATDFVYRALLNTKGVSQNLIFENNLSVI